MKNWSDFPKFSKAQMEKLTAPTTMATEREKWKGLVKYFEDLWVKEYFLHYVGSSFAIFEIDHNIKDYFLSTN